MCECENNEHPPQSSLYTDCYYRSLIATAFALWENALDGRLEFHEMTVLEGSAGVRKPADVDIDILFAHGKHGDDEVSFFMRHEHCSA